MFNISHQLIQATIYKNGIEPIGNTGINHYSEYDIEIMERCLYFERKITEITLESKMNQKFDGVGSWNNYINRTHYFRSKEDIENSIRNKVIGVALI